ncbi:MAG: hypothetical protein PV344_04385, partial [Anaplasma sp.]|nr:hypothetical protein [Anaplasma sp.]
MLTYCPNYSWHLFFANRRRFAKFARVRFSRKFSRLQYIRMSVFISYHIFSLIADICQQIMLLCIT